MSLKEWFSSWKRPDESENQAMMRLAGEARLALGTVRTALAGDRVSAESAQKLSALTDGQVDAWGLCAPREATQAAK